MPSSDSALAVGAFDRPLHQRARKRGEREARTPQARTALRISGLSFLPARLEIGAVFRMRCLFHVPTPSQETVEHGDAISRAQANEYATPKNSWNKHRIFGANFRRKFLCVRQLRRARFFLNSSR